MSINNTESYQRKTKKEAIWQCHAVISALESTKSAKRLSSRVTRESVARGDLSRHGYHQPESFSERWLGGVGAFPADGLGLLAMWTGARTTDGCSLEGKCKRIGKTKFRNQKQENSSIYECGWNGQQKNKTKVLPFQRSWLTFWQNARVSRFFFFPWDDLPVCAHPEKITQRPRSFSFFTCWLLFLLLLLLLRVSFFDARPWEFITFIVCTHSAARCKLFYGHLNWLFRPPPPPLYITCKLIPLSVAGREWDVGWWRKTHECVKDMPLMHISGERYFFFFSFKQGIY